MTLSALAQKAGVAKSTVSLIERGQGNPSIDTLWALSAALGVPFASLFHDEPPAAEMNVVRGADAGVVVDRAGQGSEGFHARHMLTRSDWDLIEVYDVEVEDGTVRHAAAHESGLLEHILMTSGSLEIATDSFRETVSEGDLISFRADRDHTYRVIEGPVAFVSLHEYPKRSD